MMTSIESALVVDDDVLMREFIVETLSRLNIEITQAGNGIEARRLVEDNDYDIMFVDIKMPGMDGIQLMKHLRESNSASLIVMVTAFGTVEQAVEAMKMGAFDFLMKPFSPEQVEMIVKRARKWVDLQVQNDYLKQELGWALPGGRQIVGQSAMMEKLMGSIKQVAASNATVLISGESGTGKELVAQAIHSMSARADEPFIRMNCAAVPDTLMDSELFGHEKGAFTGASGRRLGRFELANGGTLLLDEITEMKLEIQSKLLRVLQEQEFERVGGTKSIRTDCRIIATSNRNIKDYIAEGKFRTDLYFRLNVVPIHVAALKERPDDIPILAQAFLERFRSAVKGKKSELHFMPETLEIMKAYSWPGNVRELENLVHRLTVMEAGPALMPESLPAEIRGVDSQERNAPADARGLLTYNLSEIEQDAILKALKTTGGNRFKTAEVLGISVRTLRNKLNEYKKTSPLQIAV